MKRVLLYVLIIGSSLSLVSMEPNDITTIATVDDANAIYPGFNNQIYNCFGIAQARILLDT